MADTDGTDHHPCCDIFRSLFWSEVSEAKAGADLLFVGKFQGNVQSCFSLSLFLYGIDSDYRVWYGAVGRGDTESERSQSDDYLGIGYRNDGSAALLCRTDY